MKTQQSYGEQLQKKKCTGKPRGTLAPITKLEFDRCLEELTRHLEATKERAK